MNDLFSQLPEYDPHPDLWNRIEADLDTDKHLKLALDELPQHEPKRDLWERIEDRLAEASSVQVDLERTGNNDLDRPLFIGIRPLWASVAAAAMIVLVGIGVMIQVSSTEQVRLEYAVEANVPEPTLSALPSLSDKRAEEFIARQCVEQQLVCQRPEVHELRNQLTELTAEQQRIEQERETFGDDPALIRAQVKIENQRVEITKELITLLRS
ncbi:hypothetical protein GCM10027341_26060 [Spirosoma knui]